MEVHPTLERGSPFPFIRLVLFTVVSLSTRRPQLLVLCKLTKEHTPKYRRIFSLASQLKAGKGLTVVAAVIPGVYSEQVEESIHTKEVGNALWWTGSRG